MTVGSGAMQTPTRLSYWLDRPLSWRRSAVWLLAVDVLAVMTAASLPWSTSATSTLAVLWVIALAPTIDWEESCSTSSIRRARCRSCSWR